MSSGNHLIAAWLDDSLTEQQASELQTWLKASPENVRQFTFVNAREELLREAVISTETLATVARHTRPVPQSSTPRYARSGAAVACVTLLTLLAVATWFGTVRNRQPEFATLMHANGAVQLRSGLRSDTRPISPGERIANGTLVIDGEISRAEFQFEDRSSFTLSGPSELTLRGDAGKLLFLHRGVLLANVSPQPTGRPLRVRTPTAEAVVLGTSFAINAAETETFLRVNTGTVELHRLADNQSLKVSNREQARATTNIDQPLTPEPIVSLPDQWNARPDAPHVAHWKGRWNEENVLVAAPQTVFIKEEGIQEEHYHAGAWNGFPGLVTLREHSAVRVRYRLQEALNIGLFLVTHTESGDFSGNFEGYVLQRETPPDADGWRTATVPVASLRPIQGPRMPFRPGCIAAAVFVTTYSRDAGLELAELEVVGLDPAE